MQGQRCCLGRDQLRKKEASDLCFRSCRAPVDKLHTEQSLGCLFSFPTQKKRAKEKSVWVTTSGKVGVEHRKCPFYPVVGLDYFPRQGVRLQSFEAQSKYCIFTTSTCTTFTCFE